MEICTSHISCLRCKCAKCDLLKKIRCDFKTDVAKLTEKFMYFLKKNGCTKKESIRSLRREINHKNNLQHDLFDEVANEIWRET